jgi:hypothetical protein
MFQQAKTILGRFLLGSAVAATALCFTGCGEKEEEQAQAPRPSRPAPAPRADDYEDDYDEPAAPAARLGMTLDDLRFDLDVDRRVSVNPQQAVEDEAMAESALRFLDAYVQGDAQAFGGMLMAKDRETLDALVAEGVWQAHTGAMQEVALLRLQPLGMGYLLTVGIDGASTVTQEWTAQASGEEFQFAARTGYVNYGAGKSLDELKRAYYEGRTDEAMLEESRPRNMEFDLEEMARRVLEEASDDGAEEDEEEEPYQRPSMNPRDHIKRRYYPGG